MSAEFEQPFSGRKLYEVEIKQTVVVLAVDEKEAEEIAKREASCGGDIDWNDAVYSAYRPKHFPADWLKSQPFGDDNPKYQTCEQIIAAWEEYERTRPLTKAELESAGQQRLVD